MIRLQRELEAIRAGELPDSGNIMSSLFGTSMELSPHAVHDSDARVVLGVELDRMAMAFARNCLTRKVRQCVQLEQSGDGARLFIKLFVLTPEEAETHFNAAIKYRALASELELVRQRLFLAEGQLERIRKELQ